MEIILLVGLLVLVVINVYASRQSYRDILSSRRQRFAQIVLIWLLPIIGAALALRLTRDAPELSNGKYSAEPNMGDEYGGGRLNSQGYIGAPDSNLHSAGGDVSPD